MSAGAVRAALDLLRVRRLVLGIQDPSFPSDDHDDTGRGSPCSEAGFRFLAFARGLGFDGIQLGPQGLTTAGNPSPYDSCAFSRDPLSISLSRLASDEWSRLLYEEELASIVAARPDAAGCRVPHDFVHRAHGEALASAAARHAERLRRHDDAARDFAERHAAFCRSHTEWLERDASDALRHDAEPPDRYRFVQWVAHEQHEALRAEAHRLGLRLYGDLAIGLSQRDARACRGFLLEGYRLGAPPSRTNPEGQPWNYPLLDPDRYREDGRVGPALRFHRSRVEKLLGEFDGLRIDHPHGLVCPWVYRAESPDPVRAVQSGARLFSAPDLPDHPELARYSIARRDQLHRDSSVPRHADHWVTDLEPEQVARYATVFDSIVAVAHAHGRGTHDLLCEVLSTLPYPLQRVLDRHGLGRFRITQKSDLSNPQDVYRSENAAPEDWIMFGNHDTDPLWRVLDRWRQNGEIEARAQRAATLLEPEPARRPAFGSRLLEETGLLAHALVAELFVSPAEQVMIFFTDLFGIAEPYNRPGTVSAQNWSLRLPPDYREVYGERCARSRALDLRRALALALRARRGELGEAAPRIADALESAASAGRPERSP